LTASGLHVSLSDTEAGKRGRRKKWKGNKKNGGGNNGGGTSLGLGEICTPGQSTCAQGLRCDSPTTRQNCNSTVEGIDAWCCVQTRGSCNECKCCGNFYCGGEGNCIPNPEGQG
jgi:hypothetical protein